MPLTTTINGAVFFSSTAAVNWWRVETVVTDPPLPPVVLDCIRRCWKRSVGLYKPSIRAGITKRRYIRDASPLDEVGYFSCILQRRGRGCWSQGEQGRENEWKLHFARFDREHVQDWWGRLRGEVVKKQNWETSLSYVLVAESINFISSILFTVVWTGGVVTGYVSMEPIAGVIYIFKAASTNSARINEGLGIKLHLCICPSRRLVVGDSMGKQGCTPCLLPSACRLWGSPHYQVLSPIVDFMMGFNPHST